MISDITGNEPTESVYVQAARDYLDSRSITRDQFTKFIFRNLMDGHNIDIRKYVKG